MKCITDPFVSQLKASEARPLELRPVTPPRSEGSGSPDAEILSASKDDSRELMSFPGRHKPSFASTTRFA